MPCSLPTDSEVSDYSDDEPDNTYVPRQNSSDGYNSDDEFYPEEGDHAYFSRLITRPIDPSTAVPRRPVFAERRSDQLAARIISMVHDMNPAVPRMQTNWRDMLSPDQMLATLDRRREQNARQGNSGTQTGNREAPDCSGPLRYPPAAPAPPANAATPRTDEYYDDYLEDMERILHSGTRPLTIETHYVAPELRPPGEPFVVLSRPVRPPTFASQHINNGSFRRAPAAPAAPAEENQAGNPAEQPATDEPYVSPYAGLIGTLRGPNDDQQPPAQTSSGEAQIAQPVPNELALRHPQLPAAIADDPFQLRFIVVQEPEDGEDRIVPQTTQPNRATRQPLQEVLPPNNEQQRSSRFRYIMNRQYTQPGNGLIIDTLPNGDRVRRNGSE